MALVHILYYPSHLNSPGLSVYLTPGTEVMWTQCPLEQGAFSCLFTLLVLSPGPFLQGATEGF